MVPRYTVPTLYTPGPGSGKEEVEAGKSETIRSILILPGDLGLSLFWFCTVLKS